MQLPSQTQIYAALRYAGVMAGTLGTVATVIGLLPSDNASAVVTAFQKVLADLQQTIGDFYILAGLVCPIVVLALAKLGWNSASPTSQAASVAEQPHTIVVLASDHASAINAANTVAALPNVRQVLASRAVASVTPSPKVVNGPDAKLVSLLHPK